MIDHDRLFKELLTTFFVEFIALFFPVVADYLDPGSITFLDKEIFTDIQVASAARLILLSRRVFVSSRHSF